MCFWHNPVESHCTRLCCCTWRFLLLQVRDNVEAVLQGLGQLPCPQAAQEAAALAEVQRILAPVQGLSWPSGLPENN
jgi:hypothetical protein